MFEISELLRRTVDGPHKTGHPTFPCFWFKRIDQQSHGMVYEFRYWRGPQDFSLYFGWPGIEDLTGAHVITADGVLWRVIGEGGFSEPPWWFRNLPWQLFMVRPFAEVIGEQNHTLDMQRIEHLNKASAIAILQAVLQQYDEKSRTYFDRNDALALDIEASQTIEIAIDRVYYFIFVDHLESRDDFLSWSPTEPLLRDGGPRRRDEEI